MTEKERQFACAQSRIGYLKDPSRLNLLFDAFQSDGMPMGSDRWAEYVLARYLELRAKERTLNMLNRSLEEMQGTVKSCGGKLHLEQRKRLTDEFQARTREEA